MKDEPNDEARMTKDENEAKLSPDAEQAIARIREQWGEIVQEIIAACSGNKEAAGQLAPFLTSMEQKDDWRPLIGVLRRILAGERDAVELLARLDDTDTIIVGDVLRRLGVDVPTSPPAPPKNGEGSDDDDGKMISLDEFLGRVAAACKPDAPAGLAEQMHKATHGMATQQNGSPEMRELGRVLNLILSGERRPDLSALHPQLAEVVRKMLGEL